MKERDIVVRDGELALMWYRHGVFSFDNIINSIEINNMLYGFNLLDNDEELSRKKQEQKMAIKYKNIGIPLMSALEEMLKSVLIAHRFLTDRNNFDRDKVVWEIMRDVRKSQNGANGHDFMALINYINTNVDPLFLTRIADEYAMARDNKKIFDNPLSLNSSVQFKTTEERVQAATREYTQGFIEFRYLFERSETYDKNVDLTKLVQYGYAIQECSLQLLRAYYAAHDLETVSFILKGAGGVKLSDAIYEKIDSARDEAIDVVRSIMIDSGVDFDGIIRDYIKDILKEQTTISEPVDRLSHSPVYYNFAKLGVFSTGEVEEKTSEQFQGNIVGKLEGLLKSDGGVEDDFYSPIQEMVDEENNPRPVPVVDDFSKMSAEDLKRRMDELLASFEEGSDTKVGTSGKK